MTGAEAKTRDRPHENSFAITAQGKSIDEKPGTSLLSFKVNVK
jgi:hypothetical protein